MIEVSQLSFAYPGGGYALAVDELRIAAGESVAITGVSGIGKTTLLHLIAGILEPDAGTISIDGRPISRLPDPERRRFRSRHIGLIFQDFELVEYLSLRDNIRLHYLISGDLDFDSTVAERLEALAQLSGIADKLDRNVGRLSQGERQRVAICRAMLAEPQLLLADEPTGNLDPGNTERVLDLIFHKLNETGASFVCITHERDFLDRFQRVLDFSEILNLKQ